MLDWSIYRWSYTYSVCDLLFFFFMARPVAYEVPRPGVELELWLPAYTTATATCDLSHISDLPIAHDNARPLTHWAGPEISPTSSQILVGFISAGPQQKLLRLTLNFFSLKKKSVRVPLWCSGLRISRCHSNGSGHCWATGLIPGPGTSTCCWHGQKKKECWEEIDEMSSRILVTDETEGGLHKSSLYYPPWFCYV